MTPMICPSMKSVVFPNALFSVTRKKHHSLERNLVISQRVSDLLRNAAAEMYGSAPWKRQKIYSTKSLRQAAFIRGAYNLSPIIHWMISVDRSG